MTIDWSAVVTPRFQGRLRRFEYMVGLLVNILGGLVLTGLLFMLVGGVLDNNRLAYTLGSLAIGGFFALHFFGLVIRRLHDIGYSGWFSAFTLIPGVQLIVTVILCFIGGIQGANRYGPDPVVERATRERDQDFQFHGFTPEGQPDTRSTPKEVYEAELVDGPKRE